MTTFAASDALQTPSPVRPAGLYPVVLGWLFNAFGTVRVATYLPTIAAVVAAGESSQHSLWTWGLWLGSNLTMAAWLFEKEGRRANRAAVVSLVNAAMCAATAAVIAWARF